MNTGATKRRRRWLQFSMRSLLVLTLIASIPFALFFSRGWKRRNAVAWVKEMGGDVSYEEQSTTPSWLIDVFGIDYFRSVIGVGLSGSHIDDISKLGDLGDIRFLTLWDFTGEDLSVIGSLKKVENLDMRGSNITDLSFVEQFSNLYDLDLSGTPVTDLTPLASVPELRFLYLNESGVADLTPLAELSRLQRFYVRRTAVTALSPLAGHSDMRSMNLTESKVTSIAGLANMTLMENLDMRATQVADISPLAKMKRLGGLDLFDTPVTDLTALDATTPIGIEIGGSAVAQIIPPRRSSKYTFYLYQYPNDPIPAALKSWGTQVQVRRIFRTLAEQIKEDAEREKAKKKKRQEEQAKSSEVLTAE